MEGQAPTGKFLGQPVERVEDAALLNGRALFSDDLATRTGTLHAAILRSPHAHAGIVSIDTSKALARPGVVAVLVGKDIKEETDPFLIVLRKPMDQWSLAVDRVRFVGEAVALVVASSRYVAEDALDDIVVEYDELPAVVRTMDAAREDAPLVHPGVGSNIPSTRHFTYGDPDKAFAEADRIVELTVDYPRNSQTPLEGYVVVADYRPDEKVYDVQSNFQGPFTVHPVMSKALRVKGTQLRLRSPAYSGGGFGIKQAMFPYIVLMCVASRRIGRPIKWVEDRLEHLTAAIAAPNRVIRGQAAVMNDGKVLGFRFEQFDDYGAYLRPPMPGPLYRQHGIMTGAYDVKNMSITNHVVMTNKTPSGMVRGFGGPQGMVAIEEIMDAIARELGKDPLEIRKRNYYGKTERNVTPYYQTVEHNMLDEMTAELEASSEYAKRREEIRAFNASSPILKKGLSLTPVKFGISFTASFLNQAGALVHVYTDGSIHLNHGGTEMGQGLNTKVAQVVAEVFQVDIDRIQITATNTDKVPNTSPTAASSGTDLNGKAAQNAALTIKQRLVEFAARHYTVTEEDVQFKNGQVRIRDRFITFEELIQQAYFGQVSLSSTGFYRTPKIYYDRDQARGRPFYYYAYGAACSEVLVDTLTGEYRMLRSDILHDVGASLNPAIDIGQVEGGFVQGMGWLTMEELVWNDKGKLMTSGPASYKVPAVADMPLDLRVKLVENRKNPEDTVFHSKAVGEPPFMLGISVWCAIKDAVASLADYKVQPKIDAPATPERVLWGVEQMRKLKQQAAAPTATETTPA